MSLRNDFRPSRHPLLQLSQQRLVAHDGIDQPHNAHEIVTELDLRRHWLSTHSRSSTGASLITATIRGPLSPHNLNGATATTWPRS